MGPGKLIRGSWTVNCKERKAKENSMCIGGVSPSSSRTVAASDSNRLSIQC